MQKEWVKFSDRAPTITDANSTGAVLATYRSVDGRMNTLNVGVPSSKSPFEWASGYIAWKTAEEPYKEPPAESLGTKLYKAYDSAWSLAGGPNNNSHYTRWFDGMAAAIDERIKELIKESK